MFRFSVNGKEVCATQDGKLLHFLRDELRLLSVKNGCSEGACGTCMVIVDGKAVKACVLSLSRLIGKSITTVEGLSEREQAIYSQCFADAGAVQCGFCTPGMVISAKALLDLCPDPSLEQIREALKNNICRCTGYKKIEEAILNVAHILRTDSIATPTYGNQTNPLGEAPCGLPPPKDIFPRIDAEEKVLGIAEYCDDIYIDGMLFGGAVRLPCARARITKIDVTAAMALEGVVACFTADDLPGAQKIGHIKQDWDILVSLGGVTHTIGDSIVLVVAKTRDILAEAKKLVRIEYDELVPITCPTEAMAEGADLIHASGNLLASEHVVCGNADSKIAESAFSVTAHYSTPFTEHAFLETETAVCVPNDIDSEGKVGSLLIYSGDQGVYQTKKECSLAVGLEIDKVRVVAKIVGGGFGGKEDMSVQHHAAILAFLCALPVKVSLSRQESILVHPKRHAMEIDMTTACDKNGMLTAMKARIIADTGAYASLGGPVLQRACTHAAGPYNYHNIDIVGEAWYTNNPPAGAFRGFGVTQSCFAIEQNLNLLAEKVGISPWEIRRKNAIVCGKSLPNGQIADAHTALVETLEAIKPYYDAHPKAGIACAMKNSGIGVGLPDVGRCKLVVSGSMVHAYSSAACIGQGMGTVIVQMLCKTAGIDPSFVVYEQPDTDNSPNSGNTTASRQTVFTGEAACRAAMLLKTAIDSVARNGSAESSVAKDSSVSKDNSMNKDSRVGDYVAEDGSVSEDNSVAKDSLLWAALEKLEGREFLGEFSYKTDKMGSEKANPVSHFAYSYATHLVDIDDEGHLCKVIAAHDSGTVVNRTSIEGQIEGGVTMALGYALTEDFPLQNGVPKVRFATLGLMKSTQVPEIESILCCAANLGQNDNERPLAWGAKGVGEICSIPTAPAAALAWYNYDGEFRGKLPLEHTAYSRKKSL